MAFETIKLDRKGMTEIPQETQMTCWFAAYQMMLQYAGKPTGTIGDYAGANSPAPIKEKFEAAGIGWADAIQSGDKGGLKGKDYGKAARALGLSAHGVGQQWTVQDVKRLLSIPSPIWVAGNWDNFFHIVVVTGVKIDADLDWDEVGGPKDFSTVTFIDPNWKGIKAATTETKLARTWLPGSYAYKGIIGAWQTVKP